MVLQIIKSLIKLIVLIAVVSILLLYYCLCFCAVAKASPPGIPNLDKVGKNYVDLSWTKPRSDGGSPIKGQFVSYLLLGEKMHKVKPGFHYPS